MSSRDSDYDYPSSSEETGGWLLSYADLITLLITFFIVMLSVSTVQRNRFDLLKTTFSEDHKASDLATVQKQLDDYIGGTGLKQSVSTKLDMDGLKVVFTNTVLFESGKADVTTAGRTILDKMTQSLAGIDRAYSIVVEGYTDDVPIHTPEFDSNWELSAGRAIGVLEALVTAGFDSKRVSIQGFADTRPVESVEPAEGADKLALDEKRALNRRVVIRVY